MSMYATHYARPADLAGTLEAFANADDAAYLAGGHTLLPTLKQRLASPSDLLDLAALTEARGLSRTGDILSIGAMTTHGVVASAPLVRETIPALAALAGSIGDHHVRQRGTIGGSLANNDPAADYPAAALGFGATIVTDRRRILADDYFVALYETALEPGELVLRIEFPIPDEAGYAKFRSPASRFAVAGVMIARFGEKVRVAVTGAGSGGVFRVPDMEAALAAKFSVDSLVDCVISADGLLSDFNGDGAYRANLVAVLARRAMQNLGGAGIYT
jgi:carbon-monoxide dehydrogenase medium subunit